MNDFEKGGEVILFPGAAEAQVSARYSNEYASDMAPYLVQFLTKHGLSPILCSVVKTHIEDLSLIVNNDSYETDSTKRLIHNNTSRLTLEKVETLEDPTESEWRRVLIVDRSDYDDRIKIIEDQFKTFPYNRHYFNNDELEACVYDWILGEEAITVVANSVHMFRTFGKYIPDFNGQNPHSKSELTINADYIIGSQVNLDETNDLFDITCDYLNLKRGFGLIVLHDSLLARGVLNSSRVADGILAKIRSVDKSAFRFEEIGKRLKSIRLNQVMLRKISEYALSLRYDE